MDLQAPFRKTWLPKRDSVLSTGESQRDSAKGAFGRSGGREWSSAILPQPCALSRGRLRTALIERRHSPSAERQAAAGTPNKKAALAGGLWKNCRVRLLAAAEQQRAEAESAEGDQAGLPGPGRMETGFSPPVNPKGIPSFSPRLRRSRYPGSAARNAAQP